MSGDDQLMSKGERTDLLRLIRSREKVLKAAATQRSAELLADFENALASEFAFDDDAIWKEAAKLAQAEVNKANERVATRCGDLGIPKRFAPQLHLSWSHRGYDNSTNKRRAELKQVASAQITAIERKAGVAIEMASVEAQTRIAVAGLTSEAARAFIADLPKIEDLMPALSYAEIAGDADPPIIEQLVTPNALRQRRHRERQALRNAEVTPDCDAVTADPDGAGGEP